MFQYLRPLLFSFTLVAILAASATACISPIQITIRPFTIEIESPPKHSTEQQQAQRDPN